MKRKETQLETNLIYKGYHLSHKTYTGRNSSKVDSYVYVKEKNNIVYNVELDKNRNEIKYYSFTNNAHIYYTNGILESLDLINNNFTNELCEIYDFTTKQVKDYLEIEVDEERFIEESGFDND